MPKSDTETGPVVAGATLPEHGEASTVHKELSGRELRKPILAGTVGNFIEQFDYGIYGYLAPYMAVAFFPTEDRLAGLLSVYVGFALSFLLRPFGGMIFGRYGDRMGRKNALALAVILMGSLTALIGLLPPYAAIGFGAPVLLLAIRAAQGLVQGGEYAGAVAFIVEYAPARKRGLYTSFLSVSVFAGLLVGAGLAAMVAASLTGEQMEAWGWRIPFLVALPLTIVGLIIRLRIDETPEFRRMQEQQKQADAAAATAVRSEAVIVTRRPLVDALTTQWKPILIFAGFAITNAVLSYTWVAFIPGYLKSEQGLPAGQALSSNFLALGLLLPLLVLSGSMVDRFGRKPMLVAACVSAVVLVPVAFGVIQSGTFAGALVAQFIYLVPIMLISVALTVSMAELFPTKVRYSASAMAYNLAFGIFGGTAPLVATFLMGATGTVWAVAGYVCAIAVVSLVCVVLAFRETKGTDLAVDKYADLGRTTAS